MLKNFFLVAFRNLMNQRLYSTINILGLSIGLAVTIIIGGFIGFEVNYDTHYTEYKQLYRICNEGKFNGTSINTANSSLPLVPAAMEKIPEILAGTRILSLSSNTTIKVKNEKYSESEVIATDSLFFEVFRIKYTGDNPKLALGRPNTVYLSETIAKKYFGAVSSIGKTVELQDITYTIEGTYPDFPTNSHIRPAIIISLRTVLPPAQMESWGSFGYASYLRVKPNTDYKVVETKIQKVFSDEVGAKFAEIGVYFKPYLQAVERIHLHSSMLNENEGNGDINTIFILIAITALILLIAVANYMNLSTARFSKRAKEVGIRKVSGATRLILAIQFIAESMILAIISLIVAIIIAEISAPTILSLLNKNLELNLLAPEKLLGTYLPIALLTGLIAGLYPALFLSSFKPINTLKGQLTDNNGAITLRKGLTLFQLFITISLIVCTHTVFRQLSYIQHMNLGFNRENLILFRLSDTKAIESSKLLKEKVLSIPGVETATVATNYPGDVSHGEGFIPEGSDSSQTALIFRLDVDTDYLKTVRATIVEGRFFSPDYPTDSQAVVVNQTAMQQFGWKSAVGKTIKTQNDSRQVYHVVGVIADMNIQSLYKPITPTIILLNRMKPSYIVARFNTNPLSVVEKARSDWGAIVPDSPFSYSFVNDELSKNYQKEELLGKSYLYLTLLAIFIANLGLLGLAIFNIERKRKEISIRKVLGATQTKVVSILLKEYAIQIAIASIIAWPLAYFVMQQWLENFAYRVSFSLWSCIGATLIAALTTIITVGLMVLKAARANPADNIKYE